MNIIYKTYKQILINEGVSSFRYKFPKDKEAQLYDFYTLVSLPLWGLSGNTQLKTPEHMDAEILKNAAEEAQKIIVDGLKEQQLRDLKFSIAAEFRHMFANNTPSYIISFAKKYNQEKFIKKYAKVYKLNQSGFIEFEDRLEAIRTEYDANSKSGYLDSYKAILATRISDVNFVNLAKSAFLELNWASSYGGKPWADICDGWLKLNSANSYNDKTVWIDHVFDLQHNTDTVFNKISEYSKYGGYSWIKKALDKKKHAKSLFEFWNDMSGDLKYFAARLIKAATGMSYEQWAKSEKVDVSVSKKTVNINVNKQTTNVNKGPSYTAQDINMNNSNQSFKRIIGGTATDAFNKFPWLKDAKFKNAEIDISKPHLIWKNGTWDNGTWIDGTWIDGTWKDGVWEFGIWKDGVWEFGIWKDGIWKNGTWQNGTWNNGSWHTGTWKNGTWKDGTWKYGTWKYGYWYTGIWENGIWYNGTWYDGTWKAGTWEDGTWKYGIWKNGTWKYGIWYDGNWEDGYWYNGTWKYGIWKGAKKDKTYNPMKEQNTINYFKLYNEQIENDAEQQLSEAIETERIDELLLTAIGVALATGVFFRMVDAVIGKKPNVIQYIHGLINWAFSEYSDGSLSLIAIRKAAYDVMKADKEKEEEFGPSSSKILSKKLLRGLDKGARDFTELLGNAIGRIANRAELSTTELDDIFSKVKN